MTAPEGYCSVFQAQRMLGVSKARIHAKVKDGSLTKIRDGERVWISLEDLDRERERKRGNPTEPTHREKLQALERERRIQNQRDLADERARQRSDAEASEKQRQVYKDINEAKFQTSLITDLHGLRIALENVSSQLSYLNLSLGIVALRFGVDLAAELKRKA